MYKRRLLAAALFASAAASAVSCPQAHAQSTPTVADALGLKPVQPGVSIETPESDKIASSTIEELDENGWTGWLVLGPDGRRLRRFADTNGDLELDLWCYYQNGVEVYRDIDSDFNGKADQYRWLGTAGSRWGLDENEDGKIEAWKVISAEEVSAELIAAIATADVERFQRLLVSEEELKGLGVGEELAGQLSERRQQALRDFATFAKDQKAITGDSRWVHFAASMPGVVPAGSTGNTEDLTVYENAVAMFESGSANGQLMVGTLIRANGGSWRLIGLPQLATDNQPLAQSPGFFFTGPAVAMADAPGQGPLAADLQKLVADLEKIEMALRTSTGAATARLHAQRADVLEGIIAASDASQRPGWVRQLVDTVAAAVQEGAYPDGLQRIRSLKPKVGAGDPELQAYIDYQIISSEYAGKLQDIESQKDFPKVQEWWLTSLETFVNEHAKTAEAAQAMLQLGLSKEFEDDEKAALQWYTRVATAHRDTDAGRKAAGAVRRLQSVGREIPLAGTTLDNKSFDLARLRGKPVVIHYWATWCEPCKQDMRLLRQLQARYQRAGLQIVGVNVDGSRADAVAYVNEAKLPWPTLFAEGGLDSSPLANSLGVQTLPTMLLIDASGKVVRHNVAASQLDAEIDSMIRGTK